MFKQFYCLNFTLKTFLTLLLLCDMIMFLCYLTFCTAQISNEQGDTNKLIITEQFRDVRTCKVVYKTIKAQVNTGSVKSHL